MTFSCTYLLIGTNKIKESDGEQHCGKKEIRMCGSAIGLCRKLLRSAVEGIFVHKPLFDWRYPVLSTYLRKFSAPQRSGIHKDRWKKRSENNTAGEFKVLEKTLISSFLGRKSRCAWKPSHSCRFSSFACLLPLVRSPALCDFQGVKYAQASCHFQFLWQWN